MAKRTRRPARADHCASALVTRGGTRTLHAVPPPQRADVWALHEQLGDLAKSPAANLLQRPDDDPHVPLLQQWPVYVHRPSYRLPEQSTSIGQLAAAAPSSTTAMADTMTGLEAAGLLVWFPEYQLYILNSTEWGDHARARTFSDLLWRLGHVPQPDRPSDRWDVQLTPEQAEIQVARAETGDERWLLALEDDPTPRTADDVLAEQGFWRASASWQRVEHPGGRVAYTAQFAQAREWNSSERTGYEPGSVVTVQPWDLAWQELALTTGFQRATPSAVQPPRGLW